MISVETSAMPDFKVDVCTTQHRGFTPEELAQRCADKIVAVSNESHPGIQAQAKAFKGRIAKLVEFYLMEAVKSDRTTIQNALTDAGQPQLAEYIRRL